MPWKNISQGTMYLPSGATVAPGKQFTTKQGEGLKLRALEVGRVIKRIRKKVTKRG